MLQTFKKASAEALAEIAEEKKIRKTDELFLLFSMGSQFDHLIKQKLDSLGVFCLVADPASVTADDVRLIKPTGIILSGGPASAYEEPPFDGKIFELDVPILGICLGFQMWAHHIGVKVSLSPKREFGTHTLNILNNSPLFEGLPKQSKVMETHGDIISAESGSASGGNHKMTILGTTDNTPVAAATYKNLYGVQFHPEVTETEFGEKIYENFCFKICGARSQFPAGEVAKKKIEELKKQVGGKKVLLALSGGTDSATVAFLLKAALCSPSPLQSEAPYFSPPPGGDVAFDATERVSLGEMSSASDLSAVALAKVETERLQPEVTSSVPIAIGTSSPKGEEASADIQILGVYIKGIDRPDDEANVYKYFANQSWITVKTVDATTEFLEALKGKILMNDKRLAMRGIYKNILETEAKNFGADFIAQGTLYTDISESGGGYDSGAKKAQIKIHHNVNLEFSLPEIEPLNDCVKDTGRNLGKALGVPNELLYRQPFPGPGLVVRIEGEVTAEKLATARKVDAVYIEEMRKWKLYDKIWQAGAVVTSSMITCSKGDDAAEGHVIALWAVWSVNGFTARSAELPYDFLKYVSQKITNEIREVGGVVYRISDKPPVTIEWG